MGFTLEQKVRRVQALLERERKLTEDAIAKRLAPIESEREKRAAEEKAAKQRAAVMQNAR